MERLDRRTVSLDWTEWICDCVPQRNSWGTYYEFPSMTIHLELIWVSLSMCMDDDGCLDAAVLCLLITFSLFFYYVLNKTLLFGYVDSVHLTALTQSNYVKFTDGGGKNSKRTLFYINSVLWETFLIFKLPYHRWTFDHYPTNWVPCQNSWLMIWSSNYSKRKNNFLQLCHFDNPNATLKKNSIH